MLLFFFITIKMLNPFITTYIELCEKTFSKLLCMKNKYRSRLDIENELQVKTSKQQNSN